VSLAPSPLLTPVSTNPFEEEASGGVLVITDNIAIRSPTVTEKASVVHAISRVRANSIPRRASGGGSLPGVLVSSMTRSSAGEENQVENEIILKEVILKDLERVTLEVQDSDNSKEVENLVVWSEDDDVSSESEEEEVVESLLRVSSIGHPSLPQGSLDNQP